MSKIKGSSMLAAAILGLLLLTSFRMANAANCRRSGIKGHVYLVTGNQMPSPDQTPSAPRGFQTTLYIYELTNMSQVSREGSSAFYTNVSTELVKTISTDKKGYFKVKLKPGRYSLFVKKGERFYANQFDGQNNIHPVEVSSGRITEIDFQAAYNAVY